MAVNTLDANGIMHSFIAHEERRFIVQHFRLKYVGVTTKPDAGEKKKLLLRVQQLL